MAFPQRLCLRSRRCFFLLFCFYSLFKVSAAQQLDSCEHLRLGQYPFSHDPKIDEVTQEPENCRDATAWVECLPAPNVTCRLLNGTEFRFSGEEVGFNRTVACRNVLMVYTFSPAGLLKFCTVGFCGIGTLIDFILVAMQIVGPADGSSYIVDYYGARLTRLSITNETYRKPHP
ncbi:TM2 domain containing 1 [Nothobranchius furzeri]|uniref:TM2 domain containing 1 n=2 Tax=Nothobranchius TaxID=28779 RepID=A0A9D2XB74_NOTFU|nr:TM2 domain containing 1 [Nothobranchius furzeri]